MGGGGAGALDAREHRSCLDAMIIVVVVVLWPARKGFLGGDDIFTIVIFCRPLHLCSMPPPGRRPSPTDDV